MDNNDKSMGILDSVWTPYPSLVDKRRPEEKKDRKLNL